MKRGVNMTDLKTVVLSAVDSSNKKAVLNIEKNIEDCFGTIRLYNFKENISGILSLGFLINNTVFKAALVEKDKNLYSFNFKFNDNLNRFSCALIHIKNGDPKPLLLGSSEKTIPQDLSYNLVKNFKLLDNPSISVDETKKTLDESDINYDDEEIEEIEKVLNTQFDDRCSKCQYRDAFYCEEKDSLENSKENTSPQKKPDLNKSFYNELKNQLDILFDKYPEETFLTEVIPNSKWVKVDYEDDGNYIVIGLIYEENQVQYICYGAPGEYSSTPPKEFAGLSQWLPLDVEKPEELGYWIIYQDADTGENVEIKVS